MVTMMAGVLLLILGFTGLGAAVRFIPRPIVIGFTNGIALLIASTQIKDFLGLQMPGNPSEFFERMRQIAQHLGTFNLAAAAMGAGSLVLILMVPRLFPRIPGSIAALLAATVITQCSKPAPAPAANDNGPVPIVSVRELMTNIMDPLADNVFDAVATDVTDKGLVERTPTTDED